METLGVLEHLPSSACYLPLLIRVFTGTPPFGYGLLAVATKAIMEGRCPLRPADLTSTENPRTPVQGPLS